MHPRFHVACLLFSSALCGACSEQRAPAAPPVDLDAGPGWDAQPPAPIDCVNSVGEQDGDGDGFPRARGDCDDCTMSLGPAALDIPGNGIDEDCSGDDAQQPTPACDADLDEQSSDAEDAVRALGLCEQHSASSRLPGLISARYGRLSGEGGLGAPRQVWVPTRFGTIAPREGERLLVLSTGVARDVNSEDYTADCDTLSSMRTPQGTWSDAREPPRGYPMDSSRCSSGTASGSLAFNDVVLELELRVPSNVRAFSFDSLFFTYEYPDFVCSPYNDFFVVLVEQSPASERNVLFDENDDPIGVNTGLLSVCRKAARGRVGRPIECGAGADLLLETGFDRGESICASKQSEQPDLGGASTGWLHTEVPVQPGKRVKVRFALWDTGDPLLDSTVLLDNLRWSLEEPSEPGTSPISN